ncbi:MAG: 2-amino-4-hydroxy-6-hydroxymethyldihydropteridine diphosphokinase [Pseudomonadota bacterium]
MILIGIGGNLPGPFGPPREGLPQALKALEAGGARLVACSHWYGSHAVPRSEQADYVNAVASIETGLAPSDLLALMQAVEVSFGRVRGVLNAPRTVDLDLLAYADVCQAKELELPHPRLHLRAFVLRPLCDIAPDWQHPVLNQSATALLQALPLPHGVWRL